MKQLRKNEYDVKKGWSEVEGNSRGTNLSWR
jgi:hypothetical protein